MIDYARHIRKNDWFRHPVIGDPSFDTFVRSPANPVYKGTAPFEWPVNGTLFRDPVSGLLYVYISLYYKGYWPPETSGDSLHVVAMRSADDGASWQPVGPVLEGTADGYDARDGRRGGAADLCVVREGGRYHAVFGWASPGNEDGGIGYAVAQAPEGPFAIAAAPVHRESDQPLLLGRYKRLYASSLIRRERDWLIVAMASTPQNWGGTWALAAMTAERPEGPYSAPVLLLHPQSQVFHPPIAEFFPAFENEQYVYAPFTSLALNRGFQALYRAERERAHLPEAWRLMKYGSLWHAEDLAHEKQGIWGQTLAGLPEADGRFRVIYPAKTAPEEDLGTINFAECVWADIDRGDAFRLSAPNGDAFSFLTAEFGEFALEARVGSAGEKSVCWACRAPIGPDITTAGAAMHPLMYRDMLRLQWSDGRWSLTDHDASGGVAPLAAGVYPRALAGANAPLSAKAEAEAAPDEIRLHYTVEGTSLTINGVNVWSGRIAIRRGAVGLLAGAGSAMRVDRFALDRAGAPLTVACLATEGMIGAGHAPARDGGTAEPEGWKRVTDERLRFGFGYRTDRAGSRVKWNYNGGRFRLWSPTDGSLGRVRVYLDGTLLATIDLAAGIAGPSRIVFDSGELACGYRAVTVELAGGGAMVCDSFDFAAAGSDAEAHT